MHSSLQVYSRSGSVIGMAQHTQEYTRGDSCAVSGEKSPECSLGNEYSDSELSNSELDMEDLEHFRIRSAGPVTSANFWEEADRFDAVAVGMMRVAEQEIASGVPLDQVLVFETDDVVLAHAFLLKKSRAKRRREGEWDLPLHRVEFLCYEGWSVADRVAKQARGQE